jgi:D-serine deaminase-like pyridoxal phosphate-dependent protein
MEDGMSSQEIEALFDFEETGGELSDLETPVPVIDLDIAVANIRRWQARLTELGIANRPHIKTHKLVPFAKLQMALGAQGIAVQKLGEAEVMADAGIRDLLLTFNVVGLRKLERLAALARRTDIAVTADSEAVVEGVDRAGIAAGRPIRVLVECDTGAGRCGVQSPEATLRLARFITGQKGVQFDGLMTYPRVGGRGQVAAFLGDARKLLRQAGIEVGTVSTGGTPDMWSKEGLEPITEYRAGTYIYNDRATVAAGAASFNDCALTVLSTVVSRPTDNRAIIDAGSKSLTSDLLGMEGFGVLKSNPDTRVYQLSEEHGFVGTDAGARLALGELVRVVPNHCCPVSNLFDRVAIIRGNRVLGAVRVDARGRVA